MRGYLEKLWAKPGPATLRGIASYEDALRAYVTRNQDIALEQGAGQSRPQGEDVTAGGIPDFGARSVQ